LMLRCCAVWLLIDQVSFICHAAAAALTFARSFHSASVAESSSQHSYHCIALIHHPISNTPTYHHLTSHIYAPLRLHSHIYMSQTRQVTSNPTNFPSPPLLLETGLLFAHDDSFEPSTTLQIGEILHYMS
jgi:hypothetical protein